MARFNSAPPYEHGQIPKFGVLLTNLGTPEQPTPQALRTYLREFLSDPRVVEIPKPIWWLILHGFILTTRPAKSAKAYRSIWTPEGSPLLVNARAQATAFAHKLEQECANPLLVELAMRYGKPNITDALNKMMAAGCDRILLFPLYPQYSASTTGSTFDALSKVLVRTRNIPEIRMVKHYHDHPGYIQALAHGIRQYWDIHGKPEKLLISFHGLPKRNLELGDPYHCECHKTGRLLAEALGLNEEDYRVSFQSRFGRAEWIKPYTDATLKEWGKQKVKGVDVVCPGFSSDCLETLEEIAIGGKETFLRAGGERYRYIPALNNDAEWTDAMVAIARDHLSGWLTSDNTWNEKNALTEGERSRQRALAMGAKN